MTVTILRTSESHNSFPYREGAPSGGHGGPKETPPPLQPASAWPWPTARPDPTRSEPPRSRRTLRTTPISRQRDRAFGRREDGARRADSRRPRRTPSAFQELGARLRRCRRRREPHRPPARNSVGSDIFTQLRFLRAIHAPAAATLHCRPQHPMLFSFAAYPYLNST